MPPTHIDSGEIAAVVQKNTKGYYKTAVSQFVEVWELVEMVYQSLPCLTDVVAWGDTCHPIRRYKGELVANRFQSIVAPFAPNNFKQLCNVLKDAKAMITAFFLRKLDYEWVDRTAIPHDALLHAVDRFMRYRLHDRLVTISVVNDAGLFWAVVCSPCTADMIVMTPGRICSFYPKLTMDNVAILSSGGPLVESEYAMGSIWSERFTVYDNADFLGTDCGLYCPSLWRCISDGNLSRVVEWDRRFSIREPLQKSHTIWHLAESCSNPLCSFRAISGRYRPLLPPQTMPADLNPIEDQCFLVKRHSFTSPVMVTALLYAISVMSPHKVPVGLHEEKEKLRSLDDLEINFWVNTLAHDKFAVPTNRYRRTFSVIPHAPAIKLPNSYTIVREDPKGYPPPNTLMKECLVQSSLNNTLKGNVLVLKHVNHNCLQLVDVTDADISIINLLLNGPTLWVLLHNTLFTSFCKEKTKGHHSCIFPAMSAAVLDLINIYDGEGAVIFVQHQNHGKPTFNVKTSGEVLASPGTLSGLQESSHVLVAIDGLYNNPLMLASMCATALELAGSSFHPHRISGTREVPGG
ncbi:hypothetical protein EV702DRAFT_1045345 [Suillus placidus]|uniref:Uncharacterized protein n=1 Tax=Suillus placidus TaxID=48579 RepID=A0A9P7D3C6_9AGAM|nr:hypothetical protein EV702DRAFT_1045345 [Suillus placidus]